MLRNFTVFTVRSFGLRVGWVASDFCLNLRTKNSETGWGALRSEQFVEGHFSLHAEQLVIGLHFVTHFYLIFQIKKFNKLE